MKHLASGCAGAVCSPKQNCMQQSVLRPTGFLLLCGRRILAFIDCRIVIDTRRVERHGGDFVRQG